MHPLRQQLECSLHGIQKFVPLPALLSLLRELGFGSGQRALHGSQLPGQLGIAVGELIVFPALLSSLGTQISS